MGDIAQEAGAGVRLLGLTDEAALLEVGGEIIRVPLADRGRIIRLLSGTTESKWFRLGVHVGMTIAG